MEALLVASLAACQTCQPFRSWLGRYAYSPKVGQSGLWNSQFVGDLISDDSWVVRFCALASGSDTGVPVSSQKGPLPAKERPGQRNEMGAYTMEGERFKGRVVTRDGILDAIRTFDRQFPISNDHDGWLTKATYKYAVRHADRLYPPKLILGWASGFGTDEFIGGDPTNRVFRQLGFEVIDKP